MVKNHFNYLLNRKNTFTGLAWKDDPAIFGFDLFNEPRRVEWGWWRGGVWWGWGLGRGERPPRAGRARALKLPTHRVHPPPALGPRPRPPARPPRLRPARTTPTHSLHLSSTPSPQVPQRPGQGGLPRHCHRVD